MGERFTAASRPGPRLVEGLDEGSEVLQNIATSLFSWCPSSLTDQRPNELEGPREKARIHLLPHSSPTHCRLNPLTNCPFLIAGCLWVGPTAELSNV